MALDFAFWKLFWFLAFLEVVSSKIAHSLSSTRQLVIVCWASSFCLEVILHIRPKEFPVMCIPTAGWSTTRRGNIWTYCQSMNPTHFIWISLWQGLHIAQIVAHKDFQRSWTLGLVYLGHQHPPQPENLELSKQHRKSAKLTWHHNIKLFSLYLFVIFFFVLFSLKTSFGKKKTECCPDYIIQIFMQSFEKTSWALVW